MALELAIGIDLEMTLRCRVSRGRGIWMSRSGCSAR